MKPLEVDLCVIGAGSAGLAATAFAAQWGVKVVLVERARSVSLSPSVFIARANAATVPKPVMP